MEIIVKSCIYCPFLEIERNENSTSRTYACNRGAFGYSTTRPDKETIPEQCPLLKEDITVKARK